MATFRHKTIRRFTIPKSRKTREFKFLNHLLHIDNERDAEIFRGIVEKLPRSQSVNIVEVNEAAVAALEKPVRRAIRGVQQSTQIADAGLAAKQAKAAEEQARLDADAKSLLAEQERHKAESEAKLKAMLEAGDKAEAEAGAKVTAEKAESEKDDGKVVGENTTGTKSTPTLNIQGQAGSTSAKK